jgi:hypothetical protein
MTFPLFSVLAITFVVGQLVAWRIFRRRTGTYGSALKWSAIGGFAGWLVMIALFLLIGGLSNWLGFKLDS